MSVRGWLRKKENRQKVGRFLRKTGATSIKITKTGVRAGRKGYAGTKKLAITSKSTYKKAKKEYRDWEKILGGGSMPRKRKRRVARRRKKRRR